MSIKMHGPALDGSDKIHETDVHEDNVAAFERAGWVKGQKPAKGSKAASSDEDEGDGDSASTPSGLNAKMSKAKLVAEAERRGIKVVPDEMTNQQIIDAIEAAG